LSIRSTSKLLQYFPSIAITRHGTRPTPLRQTEIHHSEELKMAAKKPDTSRQRTGKQPTERVAPESDPFADEGLAAGAAGVAEDRKSKPRGADEEDYADRPDGAAAVIGVSGVSGGGSGTTRINNTRK
jgi:hypothetical protein